MENDKTIKLVLDQNDLINELRAENKKLTNRVSELESFRTNSRLSKIIGEIHSFGISRVDMLEYERDLLLFFAALDYDIANDNNLNRDSVGSYFYHVRFFLNVVDQISKGFDELLKESNSEHIVQF